MRECVYVSVCVDMFVCVYICNYVNVQFVFFFFFRQSLFANCVLPTMYKGEAHISVSLLLPPFPSQSVTL